MKTWNTNTMWTQKESKYLATIVLGHIRQGKPLKEALEHAGSIIPGRTPSACMNHWHRTIGKQHKRAVEKARKEFYLQQEQEKEEELQSNIPSLQESIGNEIAATIEEVEILPVPTVSVIPPRRVGVAINLEEVTTGEQQVLNFEEEEATTTQEELTNPFLQIRRYVYQQEKKYLSLMEQMASQSSSVEKHAEKYQQALQTIRMKNEEIKELSEQVENLQVQLASFEEIKELIQAFQSQS